MIDLRRFFPTIWPTDVELTDDEWEREPRVQESAVLAVYEARPRPRWTSEEPRKAGTYWARLGEGYPARVVDVYYHRGAWWLEWSDILPRPINGSGMQFSDRPIEECTP